MLAQKVVDENVYRHLEHDSWYLVLRDPGKVPITLAQYCTLLANLCEAFKRHLTGRNCVSVSVYLCIGLIRNC